MTDEPEIRELLLLVDDDPLIVDSLSFVLEDDFQILSASSRPEAKTLLQKQAVPPRLALVDLGLPPEPHAPNEGFALVGELLAFNPEMKILILSGQSEKANIQHALTLGAVDFVPKPCEPDLLNARLHHQQMILDAEQQEQETVSVQGELIGNSNAIVTLRELITQFADTPFPVLVEGESGCGKELVAHGIHEQSNRKSQPYLTINCAAFTAELLDAQLFGHAKGAFTSAATARRGFFEDAGDGCLFLDEIGELPLELQSKLLRVLENGEFYRLGETAPRQSHARVITATNRDLREAVKAGQFRQDLYHRIRVLTISVPPLREREEDCLLLLNHFRNVYAGKTQSFELSSAAESFLKAYVFPGNVRELRNIVIRLTAKYGGNQVGIDELKNELETDVFNTLGIDEIAEALGISKQIKEPGFRLDEQMGVLEKLYIQSALHQSDGNLSKTARLLGINRTTLYSKIQRLGME